MHIHPEELSAKNTFFLILAAWFVVNLLQAVFTGMSNDESYYALWGQHLAWGYFDHPPMVAVFNFLSALLFCGNLGVRFLTVLAQVGTLWLVWKMIDEKEADNRKVCTFFIISASLVMFAALGFVTTPDAPLLFFTAFFLLSYKLFLKNENARNTLLLCLSMAGMVYSKYQACLVIGFIVLSNVRLLAKPKFWLAGIGALLLLSPHFYWQYSNHFPSFQYHLVDRSSQFQLKFFLEFIPNQLAVFNPFTLGLVIYVLFKFRSKDVFERGLYVLIIGFLSFFWVMAYRGHVEPHWTVACSIPMIIILYNRSKEHEFVRKYIARYVLGSVVLILLIRVALVCPPLAGKVGFDEKKKFKAIESVAGKLPVVFTGSFQKPSMYTFFSGHPSTTISSIYNRRTQFDVWQTENAFEGKPVFVCAKVEGLSQSYQVGGQTFEGFFTDRFHSAMRLKVKAEMPAESVIHRGDTIHTSFSVHNPYPYSIDFKDKTFPVSICACFFTKKVKEICPITSKMDFSVMKPLETVSGEMSVIVPELEEGEYTFSVTTNSVFGPALENDMYKMKIVKK
ncbi:MAG: glycosyltransferase family 39 protein [Bacteroidales bacterium]|nr:glycosyltransferase family 39 protein [Bacteroidales bacterium]MDD3908158.1 glycosyltransferase family 39 protein [Bacteroidales bacterium]